MAITSEIIGKLGGGEVDTISVGEFADTDKVIYSFTLDKDSVVSAALTGIIGLVSTTGRWGTPAPYIEIRPPSGGVWGETRFNASLMVASSNTDVPEVAQSGNARYLSISASLPPGSYKIVVNTQSSSRTLTVDTATIVTTPL